MSQYFFSLGSSIYLEKTYSNKKKMALDNSLTITFIITSYKLKNNFEMTF